MQRVGQLYENCVEDIISPIPRKAKKVRKITIEVPELYCKLLDELDIDAQQLIRWLIHDFWRDTMREKMKALRFITEIAEEEEDEEEVPPPLRTALRQKAREVVPAYIR